MDLDFSFFLVVATFVTGLVWAGYLIYLKLKGRRYEEADEPILVEYARSFFPIVLIVLLLRSFLVEPFRIPSGSMMPTLLIGDFILVNKYTYGIRLPVLHKKVVELGEPQRGDIVVFRFPKDPTVDYIKRVIGLPGDRVAYYDKKLYINGKLAKQSDVSRYLGGGGHGPDAVMHRLLEQLPEAEHNILLEQDAVSRNVTFVVPEGQYFVMGDNRDNSNDSRYWGTVPERNLVGRAFFIWMNLDWDKGSVAFERIGTVLK